MYLQYFAIGMTIGNNHIFQAITQTFTSSCSQKHLSQAHTIADFLLSSDFVFFGWNLCLLRNGKISCKTAFQKSPHRTHRTNGTRKIKNTIINTSCKLPFTLQFLHLKWNGKVHDCWQQAVASPAAFWVSSRHWTYARDERAACHSDLGFSVFITCH